MGAENKLIHPPLPTDVSNILVNDPFAKSLPIIESTTPIIGGVAHKVYKITSEGTNYFLKIRGNHFASIPSITCNPADIAHEHQALTMLGSVVPDLVPLVHSFNPDQHYLILSDVIGSGEKMEDVVIEQRVPNGLFYTYGQTLRHIHEATRTMTEPVRLEGDEIYYQKVLSHRFGYKKHPVLDDLVATLSKAPRRQPILGDYAPKNIGIPQTGKLTLFDLETTHQGNVEFDFGYGLAHIVLHTFSDKTKIKQSIDEYLIGYGATNFDQELIEKIVKGIMLYRLGSIIPYPIALTPEQKQKVNERIIADLDHSGGPESWFHYFE